VKYSKSLASLDINPYYYDSADTCRKVKRKGGAAIFFVFDRQMRHITGDFWKTYVSDKSHEVLDDLDMFSYDKRNLDTSNSRLAYD